MKIMRCISFLALPLSAAGLAACASLLGGDEVKVRPINSMIGLTTEPRDALYESAVTAIDQRDYGRALDYLQADKERDPKNIKVLNALGVVYDKLGRFDLSARYYAQARAVDPASRIVASNMDYSNRLQGLMSPDRGSVVRMDLPSGLNSQPGGKPTVLASAPEVGAAARSIQGQATIPAPVQSAAPVSAVPPAEAAISAGAAPKLVQPAPPVAQEAKRVSMPDAGPVTKIMPPAAAPIMAASAPPVAKPIAVIPAPAKIDAVVKPPMAESAAAKLASPLAAASAAVERPVIAAAARSKIEPAKPQAPIAETAAIKTGLPAIVAAPPVVKASNGAAMPAKIDVIAKPQMAESAAAKLASPLPAAAAAVERPLIAAAAPSKIEPAKPQAPMAETAAIKTGLPAIVAAPPVVKPSNGAAMPAKIDVAAKPQARVLELAAAKTVLPVTVTASPPAAKPAAAMPAPPITAQSAKPVLLPRRPLPAVPATATPQPAQAVLAALSAKKVFMIGQPVRLINASGRADRVGVVARRLSTLGWTIRATGAGPTQPVTTLIYNPRNSGAAKAMQRTLPFPVRLVAERGAAGMRLVVGRDYVTWKPKNARIYVLWQKGPAVAGLQKVSFKSVR